jgi:hypothetical protein
MIYITGEQLPDSDNCSKDSNLEAHVSSFFSIFFILN